VAVEGDSVLADLQDHREVRPLGGGGDGLGVLQGDDVESGDAAAVSGGFGDDHRGGDDRHFSPC
jgi:hypothetical protein